MKIAKAVRELAMAHGLRVGRDSFGVYYVTDPATLKRVATTASHNATAAQGVAMLRRYLRQHRNPTKRGGRNPRARRARALGHAPDDAAYQARFTGGGPRGAVKFHAKSDAAAVRYATGLLRAKIGARRCVSVKRTGPLPRSSKQRNPSPRDEAAQAAQALENFTGHPARLRRARAPKVGAAGWVLGKLASVSYIATRDGETSEYVHKFRQRSRPQLLSTSDGSQLLILGGGYSVTERGIVDA